MRFRPFTAIGLRRKRCVHCGAQAEDQWRLGVCALGMRLQWYPLCLACDVELNALIVRFLQVPDGEALIARYRKLRGLDADEGEPFPLRVVADHLALLDQATISAYRLPPEALEQIKAEIQSLTPRSTSDP